MIETLRIFGFLLHKNWLVRKRQWILSLVFQILLPTSFLFCIRLVFDNVMRISTYFEASAFFHNVTIRPSKQLFGEPSLDLSTVFYAPMNEFTDELMIIMEDCWKLKTNFQGFKNERELFGNVTTQMAAILFDEPIDHSTKHFNYTILENREMIDPIDKKTGFTVTNNHKKWDPFVQIQACLDEALIKMKTNITTRDFPQIFVQSMPYSTLKQNLMYAKAHRNLYTVFLIITFNIPLFIETCAATHEKFAGTAAFMSVNGISSTLNLASWIVSGLLPSSIFCATTLLLMYNRLNETSYSLSDYIDPLVLFIVFIIHILHVMAFNIHTSAYFTKPFFLTFTLITLNMMAIGLRICVLEDYYSYLIPYVGIIFPNILLDQTMKVIRYHMDIDTRIQWTNLFENPNLMTKPESSIGMIVIFSLVGMVLNFSMAIYVNAINPGKQGVRKHPLFFTKYFKHLYEKCDDDSIEDLIYNDKNDSCFEPTAKEISNPEIQIRNLKKSFYVSLFSKKNVQALRGISVDFYKGQLTSLLGYNGAGKSTLMSILMGMINYTDGTIFVNSKNMKTNAFDILKDVGICTQKDKYLSSMTATEQLHFFSMVKSQDKSRGVVQDNVSRLMRKLKLLDVKHALPKSLSKDQKRRLCLGIAFVGDPSILLLDEPTSGLDYESKRAIWDILLEMKGKKTILLSTNDMEEADFLGDRIVIMHDGKLKSYGTSSYLKKMIAHQNNVEVRLCVERWSDPDTIRNELYSHANIIQKEDGKIIVSVPRSELSNFLDKLEIKKNELGVSSYSLPLVSLEQVFLNLTQRNDIVYEVVNSNKEKLKGISLYLQSLQALLFKNITCAVKNPIRLGLQMLMIFIAILAFSIPLTSTCHSQIRVGTKYRVNFDVYHTDYYILYKSANGTISKQYKSACQINNGNCLELTNTNLYDELMLRTARGSLDYHKLIGAAEFNLTSNGLVANALYSNTVSNSLPMSINLVSNAIIKSVLGQDYSISVSNQQLYMDRGFDFQAYYSLCFWTSVIFVIQLYLITTTLVIHPARELRRGVKHLQMMSGMSGFTYWATTFLSDLMQYTFLVVFLVIGIIGVDYSLGLQFCEVNEIMLMILLLMLYAVNALPLIYTVSFTKIKTNTLVKLLTFIPIATVITEIVMQLSPMHFMKNEAYQTHRHYQKAIFLLLPYTSFLHTQTIFYTTAFLNYRCRRLLNQMNIDNCLYQEDYCCDIWLSVEKCYGGECQRKILYSEYSTLDLSFEQSLRYLCITPILYFGLLALLEGQFLQKIYSLIRDCFSSQDLTYFDTAEEVLREKSMLFENIQSLNRINGKIFLTYELRKHYGKIKAVEDISVSVNYQECLGILGVSGAGKSVAMRMLVGEEIPDHGIIYMEDKYLKKNRKNVRSQMGYCPQQKAIIKCLNSYDHLRMFARLRGVPQDQLESEVEFWINRLNLSSCASQPSGTYSNGNKQQLKIAIALIGNPKLILLDEPTVRLDPGTRRCVWNSIKSCQAQGQSFIVAAHSMEECEAFCDRITIMAEGRLKAIGTPEELKQRFGAGFDIQIKVEPRQSNAELDEIKNAMRLLFNCTLTNETSDSLMYSVVGSEMSSKRLHDVLSKLQYKYKCIADYIVLVQLDI